ncbi:uncharacterized protein MONBRDRAFT_27269 [Monosiga brevicollis MX1]|uniref:Uncharacterized protein n=1 Tax=Monosiga brevicollis TaxID=81824 RepID=A9V4T5_MONBE|nr:uncharacterized protein MONBRDRAFT_27269 [Monosiga brevicollis MX1]EDQ87512.1 predicted protein [Monosiga brevicollis MX1]|eukprot:XP_001747772.1 hypothetical protein [Monosiga brevicollis MX1]
MLVDVCVCDFSLFEVFFFFFFVSLSLKLSLSTTLSLSLSLYSNSLSLTLSQALKFSLKLSLLKHTHSLSVSPALSLSLSLSLLSLFSLSLSLPLSSLSLSLSLSLLSVPWCLLNSAELGHNRDKSTLFLSLAFVRPLKLIIKAIVDRNLAQQEQGALVFPQPALPGADDMRCFVKLSVPNGQIGQRV